MKKELTEQELAELKQRKRETRARWVANNRERHIQKIIDCQRKQYNEDPEYRQKRLAKSAARYQYKKEASIMRNICV